MLPVPGRPGAAAAWARFVFRWSERHTEENRKQKRIKEFKHFGYKMCVCVSFGLALGIARHTPHYCHRDKGKMQRSFCCRAKMVKKVSARILGHGMEMDVSCMESLILRMNMSDGKTAVSS